jgi:hypothetical protein
MWSLNEMEKHIERIVLKQMWRLLSSSLIILVVWTIIDLFMHRFFLRHMYENYAGVAVPFQLATSDGVLSFISTTAVFGTPVDITLSELALESFFPADAATADALGRLVAK